MFTLFTRCGIVLSLSLIAFQIQAQDPRPARITEMREAELRKLRLRVEPLRLWEFSFGGAGSDNMNARTTLYSLSFSRHWETHPSAEIRASGHTSFSNDSSFSLLGIGAGWIPMVTDFSPILGAEFGYGYANIRDREDQSGFASGLFAGARLFRTAEAQMSIEAYYRAILAPGADAKAYGVSVGVLF